MSFLLAHHIIRNELLTPKTSGASQAFKVKSLKHHISKMVFMNHDENAPLKTIRKFCYSYFMYQKLIVVCTQIHIFLVKVAPICYKLSQSGTKKKPENLVAPCRICSLHVIYRKQKWCHFDYFSTLTLQIQTLGNIYCIHFMAPLFQLGTTYKVPL